MIATVYPARLAGSVRAPASKSVAHRALICAALADAPTDIAINALNQDIEATARCLRALLGVRMTQTADGLRVEPGGALPTAPSLDCGESGSTLRFLLPVAAAVRTDAVRFTGRGRLPERPNAALTEQLRAHGARVDADTLPLCLEGGVRPGRWSLPGNVSSQYVTGLLFALPLLSGDSEIRLTTRLESAAYVDMTLRALGEFGVTARPVADGWDVPGDQRYRSPGALSVEGDWSAAAFWLAANAMGAAISVEGLTAETAQGDRAVTRLLGRARIDAENVPDLVPALAVAAAALPQRTVITGAARLRIKESDRLAATAALLTALGGRAEVTPDGLIVEGGYPLHGGAVDGANDHRIVMAAAIAATRANGPVRIAGAEAVAKSYPRFFEDYIHLGGRVDVESTGE